MKVFQTGSLPRLVKGSFMAVLLGAVSVPGLTFNAAKADPNYLARQVVQGVILNLVRAIRDDLQRRTATRPDRPIQFTDEDTASAWVYDDAFAALGYNGMPKKAPQLKPAESSFQYGVNTTATGDRDRTSDDAGVTTVTNSFTATGSGDVTKIGIFGATDALTLLILGSGTWARANGVDSTTDGVAGTVSYLNGGFSTDFTVQSQSTKSAVTIGDISTASDSNSVSYTDNAQYKFDLPNAWFIEPTVGFTYTQTHSKFFGSQDGHSTEIHGGARIGTEVIWGGVHVQTTFSATAFSPVSEFPLTPQTGYLGGRAVAKWNFLWSDKFSSFVEFHGSAITHSSNLGTTGGLRWTF